MQLLSVQRWNNKSEVNFSTELLKTVPGAKMCECDINLVGPGDLELCIISRLQRFFFFLEKVDSWWKMDSECDQMACLDWPHAGLKSPNEAHPKTGCGLGLLHWRDQTLKVELTYPIFPSRTFQKHCPYWSSCPLQGGCFQAQSNHPEEGGKKRETSADNSVINRAINLRNLSMGKTFITLKLISTLPFCLMFLGGSEHIISGHGVAFYPWEFHTVTYT